MVAWFVKADGYGLEDVQVAALGFPRAQFWRGQDSYRADVAGPLGQSSTDDGTDAHAPGTLGETRSPSPIEVLRCLGAFIAEPPS